MERPQLKSKFQVEHVDGEAVFLLSERDSFVLEGGDLMTVLPLLDGTRTLDDVCDLAAATIPRDRAVHALQVLLHNGHLEEADPGVPRQAVAYWSEFDVDARALSRRLEEHRIRLRVLGAPEVATPFVELATAAGLRIDRDGDLEVVITDDYARSELEAINADCLADGRPLLLVKPLGVCTWVGPLLVPHATACWQCLVTRLRENRFVEAYIEQRTGRAQPIFSTRAANGLAASQAYAATIAQLLRWIATGSNPAIESRFLVMDAVEFTFDFHAVVKNPDCSACGDGRSHSRAGQPIELEVTGSQASENGSRSEAPEITFERLRHHISPYSGIVSHVTPGMFFGRGPIRTYVAGHNFALKHADLWFLKDGLRSHSSGKGWTAAQARTSALCEAIERHSGVYQGNEIVRRDSLAELGDDAVDPRSVMLFSERQYEQREQWMARQSRFQVVPEPFDDKAVISWSPAWSLTGGRVRHLPTSYLYYNFPRDEEPFFCWADSNGAAAGRTLQEAMVQGLLELIERDSVSLWWYNRLSVRGVDLDSFADPRIVQMREFYDEVDRDLWVLDLTADLSVPAFVALSRRRSGPTEDIMMGFGAHVDEAVALSRALTELNQFIPTLLHVDGEGRTQYVMGDHDAREWWTTATVENQPYLLPDPDVPPLVAGATGADRDPSRILIDLVGGLEGHGFEVLAVDQSRPGVELAVVKMIVPGLRHFWARLAPGRLYDVPVQQGRVARPTDESDLNPVAMFL